MIGLVPAKLEPRRARIDRVAKPTRMAGLKPQSVRSGRSTSTAYSAVRRGWLQLQGVQMYLLYFSSTDRSTTGLDGNRNSSERPQVTGARAGLPCMDRGLRGTRGRDVLLLVRPPRPCPCFAACATSTAAGGHLLSPPSLHSFLTWRRPFFLTSLTPAQPYGLFPTAYLLSRQSFVWISARSMQSSSPMRPARRWTEEY